MKRCFFPAIPLLILLLSGCEKNYDIEFSDNVDIAEVAKPYKDLLVIDIHNHDASGYHYQNSIDFWNKYVGHTPIFSFDFSELYAWSSL